MTSNYIAPETFCVICGQKVNIVNLRMATICPEIFKDIFPVGTVLLCNACSKDYCGKLTLVDNHLTKDFMAKLEVN
ncbi:MAG: hypothetical protein ACE5H1_04620 [Thermodesulfobacteriota bacterium]